MQFRLIYIFIRASLKHLKNVKNNLNIFIIFSKKIYLIKNKILYLIF